MRQKVRQENPAESKKFDIRGDLKTITIDPTVSLYSGKVTSGDSKTPLPGIVSERGEQLGHARRVETQAAKDIPDVETIFSQAATTFYALTDVDHVDTLWQYHRQLDLVDEKALTDSSIRQFERQAQLLAKDPNLKESLRPQFKTLRSLR